MAVVGSWSLLPSSVLLPWYGRGPGPLRLPGHTCPGEHRQGYAAAEPSKRPLTSVRHDQKRRNAADFGVGALLRRPVALVQASDARIPFTRNPIEVAYHGLTSRRSCCHIPCSLSAGILHCSSLTPRGPRIGETTVWPVRADAPRGSCAGLRVHHIARAMPALSDACPLLPVPVLAPREAPGTPVSCLRRLRTACRACACCSPYPTASLNLRGISHGE